MTTVHVPPAPKPAHQSLTVWGLLTAAVPLVVQLGGWELTAPQVQAVGELAVQALGLGMALLGRRRATRPISFGRVPGAGLLLLVLALGGLSTLQVGCGTTPGQRAELTEALVWTAKQRAPRVAVALVVQNNPELAPIFEQIAGRLESADGTLTPEEVYADLIALVGGAPLDEREGIIVLLAIDEGVAFYRGLGGTTGLQVATADQVAVLQTLGASIREGVRFGEQLAVLLGKEAPPAATAQPLLHRPVSRA